MGVNARLRSISRHTPVPFKMGQMTLYDWYGRVEGYSPRSISDQDLLDFETSVCIDQTNLKVGGRYVTGGGLDITRTEQRAPMVQSVKNVYYTSGKVRFRWDCKHVALFYGNKLALPSKQAPVTTLINPAAFGAEAWNKFKPAKPTLDLGVALAELREYPRMFDIQLRNLRDAGGLYLNAEFGWKPLLSDIRRFLRLTHNLQRRLTQLARNNGKWVRVGGPVSSERTVLETWDVPIPANLGWPHISPNPTGYFYGARPSTAAGSQYVESEIWFSGCFRYYMPEFSQALDISPLNAATRRMYGLNITPSLLWNLMPWSWLVDWFTNVGDIMSNLSDVGVDLVAKYAYVMGKYRHVAEQQSTGYYYDNDAVSVSIRRENVVKRRNAANPFGFGLSDKDLSVRQWAILTALGIR